MADPSYLESLMRGAGSSASLGWNDEGAAGLMSLGDRLGLLKPKDPEGIPREYAAGSQYQDNVQSLRGDDSAALKAHPGTYTGGALVGSVPQIAATAGLGAGSAATRLAASGLTGATFGGVSGAGHAERGNTLRDAAEGAAAGGAMGAAAGALAEDLPILNQFLKARQAYAGANAAGQAGAAVGREAAVSKMLGDSMPPSAAPPPPPRQAMRPATAPSDSIMPPIPKGGRTISEAEIGPMEDLANASHVAQGADNLGKSIPAEAKALGQGANKQLEKLRKFEGPPPANTTAATVRPPKGRGARANKPVAREPEQTEFDFPERVKAEPPSAPGGTSDVDKYHFDKANGVPASGKLKWKPGTKTKLHDLHGANDFDVQISLLQHAAQKSLDNEPVQLALPHAEDRVSNAVRDTHNDIVANDIERLPEDLKRARFDWMGNGYEEIRGGTASPERMDALDRLLAETHRESAGPLYRGVRLTPEQAAKFRETGVFPADSRPSSWAVDPNDARRFASPNHSGEIPVVLRQKGAMGSPMSASESEFVTPGHPAFKATRWTKEGPSGEEPYIVDVEPHAPEPAPVQTPANPNQLSWEDWMRRR